MLICLFVCFTFDGVLVGGVVAGLGRRTVGLAVADPVAWNTPTAAGALELVGRARRRSCQREQQRFTLKEYRLRVLSTSIYF